MGSVALGLGFALMALAPSLSVALVGAAGAGVGNGVEAVAARTVLQEQVDESWMALMMSFNEAMFQIMPGVGIVVGGAISALAGPRPALAAAAGGSLMVAIISWLVLQPVPAAVTLPAAEP
jgi:MFS family permease